jgi:hypothetical protein
MNAARAHDDQSALNDHRVGGYVGKDVMRDSLGRPTAVSARHSTVKL